MKKNLLLPLCLAAALAPPTFASATYRSVDLSTLKSTAGLDARRENAWLDESRTEVECASGDAATALAVPDRVRQIVIFKTDDAGDIRGRISVKIYDPQVRRYVTLAKPFTLTSAKLTPAAPAEYDAAKAAYYSRLIDGGIPGEGWFRHQRDRLALRPRDGDVVTRRGNRRNDDALALFTGSEAIRENLQLDRPLRVNAGKSGRTVEIGIIPGITVKEFDWSRITAPGEVRLDPLARCIPCDQHVVFFKSFSGMMSLLDEADARGTPLITAAIPRSEDAKTKERYARQLCLDANEFARLAGPHLVKSVAFTGSDLLLPSGSDVGIVFEAVNADLLTGFLRAKQAVAMKSLPGVKALAGETAGVKWEGVADASRTLSSYVAAKDGVVFLANSPVQLRRLIETSEGKSPALSSLPEYKFFRQRHVLDAADESAFAYLSDATIRRWCSPRWRILSARRAAAAAALNVEASAGVTNPGAPAPVSAEFGSLAFLTPVAELECDRVSPEEANAYATWRDAYQRGWREFFDPVAVKLTSDEHALSADVTVMPLILGSDYSRMIALARGGEIRPDSCDGRPGAVLQYALAIDPKSPEIRSLGAMFGGRNSDDDNALGALKPNPLAWLGTAFSLRLDRDPVLAELEKVAAEKGTDSEEFIRLIDRSASRLPVALWADNRDSASLAFFLTTLRGLSESSAPGMLHWTNTTYLKNTYVTVSTASSSEAGDAFFRNMKLHYHAGPKALFVTLSESVMKSYLDSLASETTPKPWLGKHAGLRASSEALGILEMLSLDSRKEVVREASWAALPILNELHRAAPDKDPAALYEKLWGARLTCPAGGEYRWNSTTESMESTVTGSPVAPKDFKPAPALPGIASGEFGLTFENDGVNARLRLDRTTAPARTK